MVDVHWKEGNIHGASRETFKVGEVDVLQRWLEARRKMAWRGKLDLLNVKQNAHRAMMCDMLLETEIIGTAFVYSFHNSLLTSPELPSIHDPVVATA